MTSFLNYANQYTKPFNEISGVVTELQNALACAGRVFELIEAPERTPEPVEAQYPTEVKGAVEIKDVQFSYDPEPISEPVVIAIPVNLRRFFPSDTVRNFTIQSRIDFFPEERTDWTFDEVCDKVKGQLEKRLTVPELQKILNNFGSLANNKVIRYVPNFIKLPVVRMRQEKSHGNNTTILTNTGQSELSPILENEIVRADGINGDTSGYGLISTCSALSCNGIFNLCFSICAHDTSWAKECVRVIAGQGIRVRIESTHGNGVE